MMIAVPFAGVILYIVACWLIALLGRHGKFGFWGNFWTSVILTPIIGFVILLAQDNRPRATTVKSSGN